MLVLLASLLATHGGCTNIINQTSTTKTVKLVDKIRRQLMEDNYDYLPSEGELVTPAHPDLKVHPPNDLPIENNKTQETVMPEVDRFETDISAAKDKSSDATAAEGDSRQYSLPGEKHFLPRAHSEVEEPRLKEHVVSNKDLLYYVDDDYLRNRKTMHGNSLDKPGDDYEDENVTNPITTPKVKYKVIKVKSENPSRRSMAYRRFIQEESPQGVALISLDEQPFPEFHLPRARRQYMQDRDSAEVADEMPPIAQISAIDSNNNTTLE